MSSVTAWTGRMTAHIVWDWVADCSRLVVLHRQRSCLQNCCGFNWQQVFECRQNAVVWHGRRRRADSRQPGNPGQNISVVGLFNKQIYCMCILDIDLPLPSLGHIWDVMLVWRKGTSTTTTTTTTTTTNVRIIVLPSHSCGGTSQNLHLHRSVFVLQYCVLL